MKNIHRKTAVGSLFLLLLHLTITPATQGITIQEEEELSKQLLQVIENRLELINDPFVLGYVNKIGNAILASMPYFLLSLSEVVTSAALPS